MSARAKNPKPPKPSRPQMPGYGLPEGTKGLLRWDWAEQRLKKSHNYWISTARPDGTPHTMIVWGLWLNRQFYFSTGAKSRKRKTWQRNPTASSVPSTRTPRSSWKVPPDSPASHPF